MVDAGWPDFPYQGGKTGLLDKVSDPLYTMFKLILMGIITGFRRLIVTTRAKKRSKNTLFARVLSIVLAFLIVGGSLAALIELF